jgi:hypothetical protein
MNKAIASSCTSLTENDNSPAKVITRWNMFETIGMQFIGKLEKHTY